MPASSRLVNKHITVPDPLGTISIDYQWILPTGCRDQLLVFLHEGLGSISLWKDWPQTLCEQLGCRGLVFSRYGYGNSSERPLSHRRNMHYLTEEAEQRLPALFEALGLADERPVLFGHSDGGSIALLYAARFSDRLQGIAVAAPHIFVEDITLQGIREAVHVYETTALRDRLARHHRNPESVFRHWCDTWLEPSFKQWTIEEQVRKIRCPVLAIQGEDDEYGTLEQVYGIQRLAPQTQLCILPSCGHSPHRDAPQTLNSALGNFIQSLN